MYSPTIGFIALALLGALNIVLGILILVLSFRLSKLNQAVFQATSELESRVSRLEVIMNLSESRQPRKT